MQVAVVDDDAGVRGALGRLLRVTGHKVQIYASAEEFLEAGRPGASAAVPGDPGGDRADPGGLRGVRADPR